MAKVIQGAHQFRGGPGRVYQVMYSHWLDTIVKQCKNPARAALLLWGLLRVGRNHDCVRVSDQDLSNLTGMSADTIQRARPELIQAGIIRFDSGLKSTGNIANYYQIIPPPAQGTPLPQNAARVTADCGKGYRRLRQGLPQNAATYKDSSEPCSDINSDSLEKDISNGAGSKETAFQKLASILQKFRVQKANKLAVSMFDAGMGVEDWKEAVRIAAAALEQGKIESVDYESLTRSASPQALEGIIRYAVGCVERAILEGKTEVVR